MTELLKIYPSGFLGSSAVLQTKPIDVATVASQLFNRGLVRATSRYLANQEVVELWEDVTAGTSEYKTFDFKERVLRCAIAAFGTDSVVDWAQTQTDSPDFTDSHFRWVDETLLYIFAGKRRELSANNWQSLLTVGGKDSNGPRLSPIARHFLLGETNRKLNTPAISRVNLTVRQLVGQWCQQPGGIADLTASLNVLFGAR
jgi:hypothetical protein